MTRPVVEVEYTDTRTSPRVRETRIQEIPWEEVSQIRNRERALVRKDSSPSPPPQQYGQDDERYEPRRGQEDYTTRRVERQRHTDDAVVPYRRQADDDYDRRTTPRGAMSRYDNDSDSDSSYDHRRRRRRRGDDRRTRSKYRSEAGSRRSQQQDQKQYQDQDPDQNDDNASRLWYSGKPRRDGSFFEKNFDSSYDGLIAAAAGAAMGAITYRNFTSSDADPKLSEMDPETKNQKILKTVAGAAAGAALFNAGENWYRIFTEEREAKMEKREQEDEGFRAKQERRRLEAGNGYMSRQAALQNGFKVATKFM
ncbi:hypothetical protein LTR78_009512 [Recurvomyces mirabilis]|uniref:Uncharacterized protein n=1 Tax=Recurvomyces mirabilis TaxID=574656 RepID=A0AAE0TNJ7_9PEZI|nr:hypothetical protein LTR78_009512 [Recurvomyces mirabilis]KAK5150033.1 hypothetical protein LTS14_010505 [Recurvomyces mirabilis]